MFPRPIKQISDRMDAITTDVQKVSNELSGVIKVGMVAFVLISIVAVTALIVATGRRQA